MVDKKKHEEVDPEVKIESVIGRTEYFIQQNGKTLLTVLAVIVVLVGGFFAYKYLYVAPRQEKAAAAIFAAQEFFAADSFATALNGDGQHDGFLQVVDKYGSTASGNLAKHYAGQCYLRMGEYQKAVEWFGKFTNVKGIPATMVNAENTGLTGDAYAQLGDMQKAVAQYEKAASMSENALTAPYYCRKAGQVYAKLGNNAKALEFFNRVKNEFPTSTEAREIDKYIGQVEQR
ncbi:MAG: tetratricopeptide repeat protein [Rikenellaceae bacterium]|jgi:tetratricopeptide (TPR) repeat protein|nr:tetratricopeptide repeat protein [Rikenellaceae bacterium]